MEKNTVKRMTENLTRVRAKTHELFDLAREEGILHQSPGDGFRPILWHLAHIGAFEEYWLRQKIGGLLPINEKYQSIFDPIKTPRESSRELPSRDEMTAYLQNVRADVSEILEQSEPDENNPLLRNNYIFDLVLQHELQHQETLAYLFQMLPVSAKQKPLSTLQINSLQKFDKSREILQVVIPAGEFESGATGKQFCYDNELPSRKVLVEDFALDRFLTTNAEFAEFIAEKGYEREEFWSAEGWEFCRRENLKHPLYLSQTGENSFLLKRMFEEIPLENGADLPVSGISFYEAEAYAKFRGKTSADRIRARKSGFNADANFIRRCELRF